MPDTDPFFWCPARPASASPAWSPPPDPSSRQKAACSSVTADDLATARPLGPFRDLADSVGVDLRTALTSGADRETLLRALLAELDWAGHGTVLAIEDVHWADDATLDVLRYLVRRIEQLPAVLMMTYRDEEVTRDHPVRHLLGLAAGGERTRRLSLDRLSIAAVCELSAAAGLDGHAVHAVTAGNPYYVSEVLATGSVDAVPLTVVDVVLARVRALDAPGRAAVEQLSVVPTIAERWLVDALLPGGLACLAAAEERGLLGVGALGVTFRHELTRRAVVDALPAAYRITIEARVLAALIGRPDAEPARLVHHASMAGDVGAIARYAPVAARDAARSGAHREAAAHYRLALDNSADLTDAERADLLEGSAVERYAISSERSVVAGQASVVALRRTLSDPVALGASLRWLSRMCWWSGDRTGAETAAAEAVAVLEAAGDEQLLGMAYSNQSQLDMLADRNERAIEIGARAISLARRCGDAGTLAHALCNHGTAKWQRGDADALASLEESLRVALDAREYEHAVRAYVNTIWSHVESLQLAAADALLPAALQLAAEREQLVFHDYLLVTRGQIELAAGRFDAAAAAAQAGLASPGPVRCAALVVVNRAAVRSGRADRALLDEMWQLAADLGELQRMGPAAVLAEAAWLSGGDAALREPGVLDMLVQVHDEALRRRRRACVAELGYWLRRAGTDAPIPFPDHPYAVQASGRWRAAADAWAVAGCRYECAAALAESPATDDALAALATLDAIGAAPLASAVRRSLRSRGVAHVPRGPMKATRHHPGGLTPRESEVLDLMCEGVTNAEIARRLVISQRTADHHVSAVLSKLGVRRRADAVALVTDVPHARADEPQATARTRQI